MSHVRKVILINLIFYLIVLSLFCACDNKPDEYVIKCISSSQYGKIICSDDKDNYSYGEIVSYSAICDEYCKFAGWYEDGILLSNADKLEYRVEHSGIITAKFLPKKNLFIFESKYEGGIIKSELRISGEVELAGVNVSIACPKPITVSKFYYDKTYADAKYKDCVLKYVWTKGENLTDEYILLTVEFTPVIDLSIESVRPFVNINKAYYIDYNDKISENEYSLIVK